MRTLLLTIESYIYFLTLSLESTYNLDVVFFDPHPLHRLFYGNWPDKNSRGPTELLVERVSRNPPIIAYIIENKSEELGVVGQNTPKTGFSGTYIRNFTSFRIFIFHFTAGSVIIKRIGHAVLTVSLPSGTKGEYCITLPRLRRDGL